MKTDLEILDSIRIAAPCPAEWGQMTGDERARFCGQCQKHVYNLSAMSAADAVALIREKEGQLCGRLFRRADGTVITSDCPVGLRAVARRTRRVVAACLAAVVAGAALLVLPGALARGANRPRNAAFAEVSQWVDDVLVWMGLRTRPIDVVGVICIPDPPVSDALPEVAPPGNSEVGDGH
jgi:hypothetical protein